MKRAAVYRAMVMVITMCLVFVLFSCGDDEVSVSYQDKNLFSGGINAGMKLKDAVKASAKTGWYEEKLDNYARSVKRAEVSSAEFTYHEMSLENGDVIMPRVTVSSEEKVICTGVSVYLRSVTTDEEYDRLFESYKKEFIRRNSLEELEELISETVEVKQIKEKSVFRTSTKLFYDEKVKACHYWFDSASKTGYAIYEIDRTAETTLAKYELAFLQFRY